MTLILDPDVDGFTSSALFINYFHCHFPDYIENNVQYVMHSGKQHGIDLDLIPPDTEILICADSASNDYKQHKILKESGVEIVILDHHEAPK